MEFCNNDVAPHIGGGYVYYILWYSWEVYGITIPKPLNFLSFGFPRILLIPQSINCNAICS